MASIRKLKKDIDYLVSELVIDCMNYISLHRKAEEDEAFKIVENILVLRGELRAMANHPDGKDNDKLVRKHYQLAVSKLVDGITKGYEELERIAAKEA